MRAGTLRHRVLFQQRSVSADSYGEPANTWTTLHPEQWASIEPLSARELLMAQSVAADLTHRVRLRYVAGVEPKHRILFGDRILDIRAVRNIEERNRELELLCSEGQSTG